MREQHHQVRRILLLSIRLTGEVGHLTSFVNGGNALIRYLRVASSGRAGEEPCVSADGSARLRMETYPLVQAPIDPEALAVVGFVRGGAVS
jgi:hypothetical protein